MARRPYEGWTVLQKNVGGGPLTAGAPRPIFCTSVIPDNPDNHSYPGGINASSYPSVVVDDKQTPTITLNACFKPYKLSPLHGWCDAALLNSLINIYTYTASGITYTNDTDNFLIALTDDSGSIDYYDWCRCNRITFSQQGMGGPLMVQMAFDARFATDSYLYPTPYGTTLADGEIIPAAPVITSPGIDAGILTATSNVLFSGLDKIASWSLTLIRAQGREGYVNGTNFCKDISSGMFSGVFTCSQSADRITHIDDTGTVGIAIAAVSPATAGINIACALKRDRRVYPRNLGFGMHALTYSLIDLGTGGNPCVITAI